MIIFREKCTGRFYSEGVRDFNKCINTCASPFGDIATISLFNTIEGGNITAIFVFNRAVEADFSKAKIKAGVQGAFFKLLHSKCCSSWGHFYMRLISVRLCIQNLRAF